MESRPSHKEEDRKNSFPNEKNQSQIISDDIPDAHASGDGSMGRTEEPVPDPMNNKNERNKKDQISDY